MMAADHTMAEVLWPLRRQRDRSHSFSIYSVDPAGVYVGRVTAPGTRFGRAHGSFSDLITDTAGQRPRHRLSGVFR